MYRAESRALYLRCRLSRILNFPRSFSILHFVQTLLALSRRFSLPAGRHFGRFADEVTVGYLPTFDLAAPWPLMVWYVCAISGLFRLICATGEYSRHMSMNSCSGC